MSNNKQDHNVDTNKMVSSVDWFKKELEDFGTSERLKIDWKTFDELFEQAKAIHKEEIRLIYEGLLQNVGTSIKKNDLPTFEEFYKETYGGNK